MILLPAIDVRGGRAVRLRRGDFARETVYADDPLDAARSWVDAGAQALHVVDLDGARSGEPASLDHLRRIAGGLDVPVQYGGGLRSPAAVAAALDAGAERVVVGTAALLDERFLEVVLAEHGERIAVAVDARGGRAAVTGWTTATDASPESLIARLQDRGVGRFVYTDVERDGMLAGPDVEALRGVVSVVQARLIYSGGVASVGDLRRLATLGLEGVITGKALYERRFTVAEAQEALACS